MHFIAALFLIFGAWHLRNLPDTSIRALLYSVTGGWGKIVLRWLLSRLNLISKGLITLNSAS